MPSGAHCATGSTAPTSTSSMWSSSGATLCGRCVRRTRRAMRLREPARTVGFVDLRTHPGTALLVSMSREEYDEIGEVKHAEWWDGVCVVTPGGMDHNRFAKRLFLTLDPVAPTGHECLWETGVRTADADFIPDLTLFRSSARVDDTNHWLL